MKGWLAGKRFSHFELVATFPYIVDTVDRVDVAQEME